MTNALMSNEELDGLRSAMKQVTNPRAQWREKPGRHRQRNFTAEAEGGAAYRIYLRQNLDDDQDFSCGLSLVRRGGRPLSLVRYNGGATRTVTSGIGVTFIVPRPRRFPREGRSTATPKQRIGTELWRGRSRA